ncbi:NAD(+) synthase [Mailhella sp.]|uniref:NAD(+) synthase n=1 Tax=Mailhella sp. TaxID=1981029 RepID=UPI003AB4ECD5
MHIFLLQHNPIPGDFQGNAHKLADMARKAVASHPVPAGERALCVTPAYALAGVPWEPLKHIGGFYRRCRDAAHELADMLADGPDMLISLTGAEVPLYVLLSQGKLIALARQANGIIRIPGGPSFYLPESEPAWAHQEALGLLKSSKAAASVDAVLFTAAELFLPETQEKNEMHCSALASLWKLPVLSVHQCGAVDSLVYSGRSFALDASGEVVARASAFEEAALAVELSKNAVTASAVALNGDPAPETVQPVPERPEALFRAATLGVRDYVRKCGMSGVVLGLSGGMDSALVACLAVEALGAENVLAVLMPSRWSTDHSEGDAETLAKNLGIKACTARITPIMDAFDSVLAPLFADLPAVENDLTADNIQPRIRGTLLMAFANRLGRAVLGTGNKSENAVGYCTLYGDTVGALEPIGDLYKTEVYEVARWYNDMRGDQVIPEHIFTKAPSAELHPGQVDEESLPPYEILDAVLRELLENAANPETLVVPGVADDVVRSVVRRLASSEFKRHQSAPALKLSSCTLGVDWHLPAVARGL